MIVDRKKEIGKKTFVSSKRVVHHTLRHFYGLATFRFGERHFFFFGPSFWSLMDWSFSGGSINQMMGVLSWAFIANCHCRPQLGWELWKPGLIRKKWGHFCVNTNAYPIGILRWSIHILGWYKTKYNFQITVPYQNGRPHTLSTSSCVGVWKSLSDHLPLRRGEEHHPLPQNLQQHSENLVEWPSHHNALDWQSREGKSH